MKAIARSRMQVIRMATALLIRLRRAERMVEGQLCRSVILPFSIPRNLFPHAMYEEAATPNEPERGFFHFFSSGDSHRMDGGRRGVSPSPAAGYVAERIYTAYAGLRKFGTRSDKHPSQTLGGDLSSNFSTGSLVQYYRVDQ